MDIKAIIILVALVNLWFGGVLFRRGKKNRAMVAFSLFAVSLGVWSLALYFYEHPVFFSSFIWIKIVYSIVLLPIIPSVFYFAANFPKPNKNKLPLPLVLYVPCCLALLATLWFSELWVKGVEVTPAGLQTLLGPAYIAFGVFSGLFGVWLLILLIRSYVRFEGVLKMQLRYVFVGLFLYIGSTVLVDVVMPLISGNSRYFWLSPLFSLFFISSTAYAITRYRLMDVRLVLKKGTVFIIALAIVVGLTLGAIWLIAFLMDYTPNPKLMVGGGVAMALSILIFVPLRSVLQKLADKLLFKKITSYQGAIRDLASQVVQSIELNKVIDLVVQTTQNTMGLDRAGVLLRDSKTGQYKVQRIVGFKEENGISLVRDNFLTDFLQQTKTPVVYEELSLKVRDSAGIKEREQLLKLEDNMKRIEAGICLPLFQKDRIMGIIVLGKKLSGDPYSKEDLELLITLANQASIALQNARLYDEVQDLSQNLQDKVDEQTKELTIAYKELKRTDQLKSEFLGMSSHQLRTPLTAIKGYLSMALEGDYGKVPAKMKGILNNVFTSTQRLVKIVSDLLDVSRIDLGKMKLDKSQVNIDDLLYSCYTEMQVRAEEKGLKLVYKKPPTPLPKLNIDELKIRQVMLNLIDNAVRYTNQGQVTISSQKKDSHILIQVKDTGAGLTSQEQQSIFEGFARGIAGINYFTEGAGLGLYVSRKYLDLHQGKIWAESPGKGKGSTFFVELPIK